MMFSGLTKIRDPFVLRGQDAYYLYGTDVSAGWEDSYWVCYKSPRLEGPWTFLYKVEPPADAVKHRWAPEVHVYQGAYYLFGTYYSEKLAHRGCAIFRSDSPEGPFRPHSDGVITPATWDAIDGTLYVDEEGTPWMVFVHEWTSTADQVGTMAVAKLSADLRSLTSEPLELFRADEPAWAEGHRITDGCFLYRTEQGILQMLWSNLDHDGYCVALARSLSGRVEGPWEQEGLLYSKQTHGADGGHGMLFRDFGGNLYLSIHSPNSGAEQPVFLPMEEFQ